MFNGGFVDFVGFWIGPSSPLALLLLCTRVVLHASYQGHIFCPGSSKPHRGYILFYPRLSNPLLRNPFVLSDAFCLHSKDHFSSVVELVCSLQLGLKEWG